MSADTLRETIARGIYDARPFRIARSGGVMEMMVSEQMLDWDAAPDWYRNECFDIADAVQARMLLSQQADQVEALALIADAARVV